MIQLFKKNRKGRVLIIENLKYYTKQNNTISTLYHQTSLKGQKSKTNTTVFDQPLLLTTQRTILF